MGAGCCCCANRYGDITDPRAREERDSAHILARQSTEAMMTDNPSITTITTTTNTSMATPMVDMLRTPVVPPRATRDPVFSAGDGGIDLPPTVVDVADIQLEGKDDDDDVGDVRRNIDDDDYSDAGSHHSARSTRSDLTELVGSISAPLTPTLAWGLLRSGDESLAPTFRLMDDTFVVGRRQKLCHGVLPFKEASGTHFTIHRVYMGNRRTEVELEDHSTNGTHVNTELIRGGRVTLRNGDIVSIRLNGSTGHVVGVEWTFHLHEEAIAKARKPPRIRPHQQNLVLEEAQLGSGSYGRIQRATVRSTGMTIAVKRVRRDNVQAKTEVGILEELPPHKNLVEFHSVSFENSDAVILLEWVEGGCLREKIEVLASCQHKMKEHLICDLTRQILLGVRHMHEHGIAHNDLKTTNVLITKDSTVKLADFGSSFRFDRKTLQLEGAAATDPPRGTSLYMSPECIRGCPLGGSGDIWALGCIVVEMLTGQYPWYELLSQSPSSGMEATTPPPAPDLSHQDSSGSNGSMAATPVQSTSFVIERQIVNSEGGPPFETMRPDASPEVRDFLSQCFCRDPTQRATCADLIKHPWIQNDNQQTLNSISECEEIDGAAAFQHSRQPSSLADSFGGESYINEMDGSGFSDHHASALNEGESKNSTLGGTAGTNSSQNDSSGGEAPVPNKKVIISNSPAQ
eukprot:PhM_4_TR18504/c1_g1_i1/m.56660